MEALREQLLQLSPNGLCEPRVRVAIVLEEALDLLTTVRMANVSARLLATGLALERLDELAPAIDALRLTQDAVTHSRCPDADFAEALMSALELRDEMVAACHWNLRQREVGDWLVRITDSSDIAELSLDLKELAQLVRQYQADFAVDGTFDGAECVRQALALADELTATTAREVPAEVLDLRDRAFTHLAALMEEVRNAGRYAFRADGPARRAFATDSILTRKRSNLNSVVNSLLG